MVNGSMCGGCTSTALMVRVGPEGYERALAQPLVRPMEFSGRPLAGFVSVDSAGYPTDTGAGIYASYEEHRAERSLHAAKKAVNVIGSAGASHPGSAGHRFRINAPGKKPAARRPRRKAALR